MRNNPWFSGVITTVSSALLIWIAGAVFGLPKFIENKVELEVKKTILIHQEGKHDTAADIRDVTFLRKELTEANLTLKELLTLLQRTREEVSELKGELKSIQRVIERKGL